MNERTPEQRYWRTNKIIIVCLLAVWLLVSFVPGILFVETLNRHRIAGFPLGFWMAHQGSILGFLILTGVYCLVMEYEDRRYHLEERPGDAKAEDGE